MAALTLDHLSGGRMRLGLGVSGPQVAEGWHGASFDAPIARTREYVDIVRGVLRREAPVTSPGPNYPLPLPGGEGKALKPNVRPLRPDVPIYLAAMGPRNVALAAEIAEGWIPFLYSPEQPAAFAETLAEGSSQARTRISASSTSRRWCRSRSTPTSGAAGTSSDRCSRSTPAAWARPARTSTRTS